MNTQFDGSISKALTLALAEENPNEKVLEVMDTFASNRLGINANRNYFVLDENADVLGGSIEADSQLDITDNIITAMSGQPGDEIKPKDPFMDYAWPVTDDNGVRYIIYVRDNKDEVSAITDKMFGVIVQSVLYGALLALFIGIFMSRTITAPIRTLTHKARKMAEGKFDTVIEAKGDDEISRLTETFNIMAAKLKSNLDEISTEKDKIEVILKSMADGVIAFDAKGKSTHINPAAVKMLSVDRRVHYSFSEFFERYGLELDFNEVLNNKEGISEEFAVGDTAIKLRFAPYKTESMVTEGIIAVFQDVTVQQKLDLSRREFVANVSHELRTPITNIKSYSETLLDNEIDDPEIQKNFLGVINKEADRMARLVQDLLVLSQLDSSKSGLKFEKVNLNKFVNDVINTMSIEAKKKNQILTFIESGKNISVFLDRDRINQVIVNIVSNAIKYTPEKGTISIITGQQKDFAYIKVTDTGMGIDKKDLPKLFERFYRVDKARSRKQGGTGLGLAIAKEITEAHGGSIHIDSIYNKGTAVTIKLPLKHTEDKKDE